MTFLKEHKLFFLALAGAFAFAVYFGMRGAASEVADDTGAQMKTVQVSRGDIAITVSGVGQVFAAQQVDVQAVAAGDAIDITAVYVENNESVTKGQVLVTLDARDAQRSVRDAQLSLSTALIKQKQTDDQYYKETIEHKWQRQLQENAVASSQSNLNKAYENLADYTIRAPFDGIVTDLAVAAGDSVSRSDVLASIITAQTVAVVSLNEVDAVNVSVGDSVTLTFDALPGKSAQGSVTHIDTIGAVSQGVVSYDVEMSIDTSAGLPLKPGMSVNADIAAASVTDAVRVPVAAVTTTERGSTVDVVSADGTITSTSIETGLSDDFFVEVTSGLAAGATVVTEHASGAPSMSAQDDGPPSGSFLMVPGMGGGH